MRSYIGFVFTLVRRDVSRDVKSKETIVTMIVFAVLTIVIFGFAFDPRRAVVRAVTPGIIWVMILFSGILGLNRTFEKEFDNDSIIGLMLVPVDHSAIFLGKLLHNFIRLLLVEAVSIPLLFLLFDLRLAGGLPRLLLVLSLATFGFVAVGTLLAALAAVTRWSDLLLPLVVLPVASPVLISAVMMTGALLEDASSTLAPWLGLLLVFDLVFFAAPLLLFDYILEA